MWYRTALILIAGVLFGFSGPAFFADKNQKAKTSSFVPAGKHLAALTVMIENPGEIPKDGDTTPITITGKIRINSGRDGIIHYKWNVPSDVQILDGEVESQLNIIPQGQILELKLTVAGFNKEKQRMISLQADLQKGNQKYAASSLITSRPEDTLEHIAPDIKKSADEQLGSPSKN